ncbi:MAG: hypothetical protein RLZZ387_8 [Chloroflexota bacterium]|jgi:hypothetical protein
MRHHPPCDQANPTDAQLCTRCGVSLAFRIVGRTPAIVTLARG